jgi:thiol-disulfide isomerase/thioredoxin
MGIIPGSNKKMIFNFNNRRIELTKILFVILFSGIFISAKAQEVESLSFDQLKKRISTANDTLYVINFWATWCKPCVEELPSFENCNKEYKNGKFKMILVNLDFNSRVNTSVKPFITRKNLQSEIVHINETDPNQWINKVDSTWSGAIPATTFYKYGQKIYFIEGSLKENELREQIEKASIVK